jgi:hypothetical protein
MFRRSQPRAEEIIERYVEWRENEQAVWHAYDHWAESRGPERDVAFCVYRVALTREQCACDRYAQVVGLTPRSAVLPDGLPEHVGVTDG